MTASGLPDPALMAISQDRAFALGTVISTAGTQAPARACTTMAFTASAPGSGPTFTPAQPLRALQRRRALRHRLRQPPLCPHRRLHAPSHFRRPHRYRPTLRGHLSVACLALSGPSRQRHVAQSFCPLAHRPAGTQYRHSYAPTAWGCMIAGFKSSTRTARVRPSAWNGPSSVGPKHCERVSTARFSMVSRSSGERYPLRAFLRPSSAGGGGATAHVAAF